MVKKDGKSQDDAKKTIDLTNILYQLALLQGDDSRTVAFVDILLRQWGFPSIYDEDGYFYDMAARSGTLWEHSDPSASLIHGFTSHVLYWMLGMAE